MSYSLSVVMIIKNEAHNLAISLPALDGLANEIIILDSGSTDNSRQIAEQYGAKWFVNTNWQGFGKQRQFAQSYATGEWILALDADEEITDELKQSILTVIKNPPNDTVYGLKRLDFIAGRQIDNPYWGVKAYWRLFPKQFGFNDLLVHESLDTTNAKTQVLSGFLHHHTAPDLEFLLQKRLSYAKTWANEKHQKGKKSSLFKIISNPIWQFIRQYFLDGRFLQGKYGLIYSCLFAQYTFNKYAILYDLTHNQAEQAFLKSVEFAKSLASIDLTNKKSTLSLVMICKNESKHLKACLDTVHDLVDEIIVLDSGSTDDTRKIAEQYGAKWHVNTDWQGFGKQRQLAQSYATSDYVLVLDADERLDDSLRDSITKILHEPPQTHMVFALPRVNLFCGVEVLKRFWYADNLARLYANSHYQYNDLEVHESLDTKNATIKNLSGYLLHLTNDDFAHFVQKNIRYSDDWARDKSARGKKTKFGSVISHALFSFSREYVIRGGMLGGAYGVLHAGASSSYTFNKYLILWQLNQNKHHHQPCKITSSA
ncbi:glycosyltransferase family 2 protein [Moraxella bovis]|uniref:glycosyltransferase family 2 protein n=1 Tax=Moraxella bovis TaxID=476 RepID=UPI001FD21A2D|nr:glycosyltransferase family 2 protein [Moraxella bovis]UZA17963.1 glycosyltransferase family 2 protein [Moraxella bovis]